MMIYKKRKITLVSLSFILLYTAFYVISKKLSTIQ
jgi:hypothetical protein